MTADATSSVDRHNLKFSSSSESAHNIVGAGSTSNDSLTFCNICATNGFPHEAIRFVKVGLIEEIVPFDDIVCKVVRRPKYFVYNHFQGGRHYHKYRRSSGCCGGKQREAAA
jgi:hypothetical protein